MLMAASSRELIGTSPLKIFLEIRAERRDAPDYLVERMNNIFQTAIKLADGDVILPNADKEALDLAISIKSDRFISSTVRSLDSAGEIEGEIAREMLEHLGLGFARLF
ncbi:hypothetical protein Deipr_0195 [Deinococcus proteolyticus MRP]|uniref:Uncharacterized protein n=1 Tax=Deinococcus proteolyticus (strain ATCC 35074 / DSM 20540 / JCM 6276 / NBRC 101906 / NCIMB 13154 / VKM Ac-1939 / CCM 2703 / MRP) TaxID=693977 RepID=F0RP53_DEIPM|nr:hypothetical protein [Deinococcus proteolyticus]ADY25368.1 hypothetical protein Deipr_0195 [Deinococcus proteolyticus MRP]